MFRLPIVFCLSILIAGSASAQTWRAWSQIALDQAVLSHRMTKSACLVMLGVDAEAHLKDIEVSSERFLSQNDQLTDIPEAGQVPAGLRASITTAQEVSAPIVASARQISAGDVHTIVVNLLINRNLAGTEDFLALPDRAPRSSSGNVQIEAGIQLTAQLRATSQELLRDLCIVRAGLGSEDLPRKMADEIARFVQITGVLIEGDAARGIPKAPNIQIKLKLKAVQKKWATLSKIVLASLEKPEIETGDIKLSSVMGDSVLAALDEVLIHYNKL